MLACTIEFLFGPSGVHKRGGTIRTWILNFANLSTETEASTPNVYTPLRRLVYFRDLVLHSTVLGTE